MSICIPCIMEIININMSQVFRKVSASFMCSINKAHFRTVMQYFALSFSLIAWPCKYAAYRSDCDLHKNGSAFQSCFCTVHALQKPQLFCFQCMAWPLLLMQRDIVRRKCEAVSHLGIFNLKWVDLAFYPVCFWLVPYMAFTHLGCNSGHSVIL